MGEPGNARSNSETPGFRLGSVPAVPEEMLAFLQRRIAIFLGFTAAFWAVTWILSTGLSIATTPEDVLGENRTRVVLHLLAPLLAGGAFWFLRRRQPSERALRWIETAATLLQALAAAGILVTSVPVIRFRPDVLFILGLSFVLTARASLIPSSPRRTLLIGIGSSVPLVAATFVLYRLADEAGVSVATFYPGDRSTPLLFACWASVFSGMAAGVSTFVSAVIYGLQREVQIARKLGQYTLERELGSGGMGVVYLARHALLRRPTAVKLLLPERAGTSSLARFEREVQITSSLTHPNTVAIYDYGRTLDGTFYYAMEHLDGLDLQTLVERCGPLPPARVRHFLRQIAGALSEAHRRGLIHRDVKPSNIMVCERGFTPDFVKVLDFGLARPVVHGDAEHAGASVTQAGHITGTPLYLSPEQIQTPDDLDGRSDLYALGAVGYFLLTGHALFSGSVVEVCAHHLHTAPPRASQRSPEPVPRMLENVLLTCLEKDRARRPRDASELAQLLDACSDVAPWTEDEARAAAHAMPRGPSSPKPREPEHNSLAVAVTARDIAQFDDSDR